MQRIRRHVRPCTSLACSLEWGLEMQEFTCGKKYLHTYSTQPHTQLLFVTVGQLSHTHYPFTSYTHTHTFHTLLHSHGMSYAIAGQVKSFRSKDYNPCKSLVVSCVCKFVVWCSPLSPVGPDRPYTSNIQEDMFLGFCPHWSAVVSPTTPCFLDVSHEACRLGVYGEHLPPSPTRSSTN